MIKTLKFRVKDSASSRLKDLAKEVNFVWNYVNELSFKMIKDHSRFLSAYDIHSYLVGATKSGELHLLYNSVQEVAEQYCSRRKTAKKRKLRWRISSGKKRSLGWIPFKIRTIKLKGCFLWYKNNKFKVWDSYGLENYKFRSGSFNEDSRGRWYLNICVDTTDNPTTGTEEVGIDLGLKDFATLSNGEKIEAQKIYRDFEPKLTIAQRANKKKRVKAIHAKIVNKRKDFLHKLSTKLIDKNYLIAVGNVNSSKLAKTNMAKSVLDAGWSMFRTMLEYKAIRRQALFIEVNEAKTSLTCSTCNGGTGPQGLVGLGIREWTCSSCGSIHDRDINAAKNILALGYQRLAVGISS